MTKLSYTMTIENDAGIEETLARGIPLEDALKIAIEHDGAGEAVVTRRDVGKGRLVSVGRRLSEDGAFDAWPSCSCRARASPVPTRTTRGAPSSGSCSATRACSGADASRPTTTTRAGKPRGGRDMTEKARIETFLPGFGGFHGTCWENLFPFSRERCAERFARYEGAEELTAADLGAILCETSDASRFFASLARGFCRRFDADTSRWLGFELGLTFSELDIPAARGGTTDFILATMPVYSARKLFARSAEEGHRRLVRSIRDRFAPYNGVVPYPDNAVQQGLAEPIERWGRVELCDLLAGFVDPELDERLYAEMTAGCDVRMSFDDAVDWKRFSELVAVRRRTQSKSSVATGMPAKPNP